MMTSISFHVKRSEIDKMGIVHHANYLKWFEAGRRDYLSKAGITDSDMGRQGFQLPLSRLECTYRSPLRYGDEIEVITGISSMSCAKVKFEYRILNKSRGTIAACGKTVHAWTDKNIRPINMERAAPHIYASLKAFTEARGVVRGEGLEHNSKK